MYKRNKIIKIGFVAISVSVIELFPLIATTEIVPDDTFVDTGSTLEIINDDDIETLGDVTVVNGGKAVFWSSTKVVLKPGFWAIPAGQGYFRAAIDSDLDGFSDVEESIDSDGDGMHDSWEVLYAFMGLNPNSSNDGSSDGDNDGVSAIDEYQNGSNPSIKDAPGIDVHLAGAVAK